MRHLFLLVLVLVASCGGGRGDGTVVDRLPRGLARETLSSTVWIGNPSPAGVAGYASAVVLGPRRCATNAHAWSLDGETLPEARELLLREEDDLVPHRFHLVASGWRGIAPKERGPADDWALLEADAPCWPESLAATPHPDAGLDEWAPADGSTLLVAGYSTVFTTGELAAIVDGASATPEHTLALFGAFLDAGPYVLRGEAAVVAGEPQVACRGTLPAPVGHSGGGVYAWASADATPRLVGVFRTWAPSEVRVVRRVAPLGLTFLGFDVRSREEARLLGYVPLAEVLAGESNAP